MKYSEDDVLNFCNYMDRVIIHVRDREYKWARCTPWLIALRENKKKYSTEAILTSLLSGMLVSPELVEKAKSILFKEPREDLPLYIGTGHPLEDIAYWRLTLNAK